MGYSKLAKLAKLANPAKLAALSLSTAFVAILASPGAVVMAAETKIDHSLRQAAVSRMASRLGGLRGTVEIDQPAVFLNPETLKNQRPAKSVRDKNIPGAQNFDLEPTGSTKPSENNLPIVMYDLPEGNVDTMATGSIAPASNDPVSIPSNTVVKADRGKRSEPAFEVILTEENVKWPLPSMPSVSFAPIINLPKTLSKLWNAQNGPSVIIPLKEAVSTYPTRG